MTHTEPIPEDWLDRAYENKKLKRFPNKQIDKLFYFFSGDNFVANNLPDAVWDWIDKLHGVWLRRFSK